MIKPFEVIYNRILHGNSLDALKTLPDCSVDCCITSPPYYGLRDYGVDAQIGLEKTPEDYIRKLVQVFREVHRILRDEGTLWVNIGDCYAGSGKGGAMKAEHVNKYKQGTNKGLVGKQAVTTVSWGKCKPKDLVGIPWMLAFSLRDDGWYLRQDIIWNKSNPMPESVTDRCTKSHEYIFLLSKSGRYYFDNRHIKEKAAYDGRTNTKRKGSPKYSQEGIYAKHNQHTLATSEGERWQRDKDGNYLRNKRSVWTLSTEAYPDAHYAVFPQKLILPCILSGCPENGIVLDPFMGSGTTAVVAVKNLRKYIGCEINLEYIKIAEKRIAQERGLWNE